MKNLVLLCNHSCVKVCAYLKNRNKGRFLILKSETSWWVGRSAQPESTGSSAHSLRPEDHMKQF